MTLRIYGLTHNQFVDDISRSFKCAKPISVATGGGRDNWGGRRGSDSPLLNTNIKCTPHFFACTIKAPLRRGGRERERETIRHQSSLTFPCLFWVFLHNALCSIKIIRFHSLCPDWALFLLSVSAFQLPLSHVKFDNYLHCSLSRLLNIHMNR